MGGASRLNEINVPAKVVVINTQFVETDARSFKSVVQNLTGKDATIPAAQRPSAFQSGGGAAPVFSRGTSFKDFERMMKELPSLDELNKLYPG